MKRKSLLFALLVALFMPWAANAQETFTVCDGTNTNSNVPIYGLYCDNGVKCEFVIPADLLSEIEGGTINAMKFYLAPASYNAGTIDPTPSFTIFMKEVSNTTMTAYTGTTDAVVVYNNDVTITTASTEQEVYIEFTDSYTYQGGNLLVGLYQNGTSGYKSTSWYGLNQSYNSAWQGYGSSTGAGKTFIPKTTFTYTAGSGVTCEKPETLVADNITSESASLTWTGGSGVYNIELNGTIIEEYYEGYTYDLRDLTATTSYTVRVQSVCDGETPTSGWKSMSFTTPCAAYDIPYTYGFEDAAPFDCWTVISGNITRQSGTTNTGSYRLDFRGTTSNMIALPQFNEATNNLRVEFYTRPESTSSSCGKFAIGYMTDITDANTFVAVGTYPVSDWSTASYVKKTVDFVDVPANANIAMRQFDCSTNYYWYVDDVTVKEIPSCLAPTALAATNITTNSSTITWTPGGNETQWRVEYNLASVADPFSGTTGHFERTVNGEPTCTITDLPSAATSYVVRVIAICGDEDESEPSEVLTFATACDVIDALGYEENFDDYSVASNYTGPSERVLPTCWNAINTTTYSTYKVFPTIYYYSSTNYANSTPNSLKFYSYAYYSSGTTTYDPQPQYAILPEMENLAGTQITLSARGYYANSTFKIGTMTDPTDASTFNLIAEQTGLTTSYQEFEYIVPATCTDSYLAIMIDAATSSRTTNGVYIDDISITEAPTCTKPMGLEVVSVATTTATLSWTETGTATAWQICLNGDEENLIMADDNQWDIEGLTAATAYTAKVRAYCDAENQSDWSDQINFTTECDVIATFPWMEDFNSLTAGIPNCWDNSEGTTTNETYKWNYYAQGYDGAGLRFNSYNNSSNNTNFLKTSTLSLPADQVMELSFWYKNPTGGDFSVYISTDGGATYTTALATGLTGVSSWTEYPAISLANYAGQEVVIVFKGTSNYGNGDAYIYLDNVAVKEAPSCLKPTDLAGTADGLNATITWVSEAGAYEVAHATDATADPDENIAGTATEATYTMNDLALGDHYFWVRANCGSDGYSEWVGPVSVHIGYCVPAPTSVDGNGISNVTFGMGDNVVNNDTSMGTSVATYLDYSSQIGAVQAGVESTIAITYATGSSTVYSYGTIIWVDFDNSLSFEENEIIYTGTSTQGTGGTPQLLEANITIPATVTPGDYMMRIAGADDAFDDYISGSSTTAPNPCYTGSYACFQDYTLRVLEAPSCLAAGDVTVALENITSTSAVITWTNNNGEEATYTVMQGETVLTTTAVDSYELTGLNTATTYDAGTFTIISNCDENAIANVPAFSTLCDDITALPWSEDFESFDSNTVPNCWDNSASTSSISSSSSSPNCIWGVVTVSGNNMIKMENYWASSGTALINTPTIVLPAEGTYQLTFDYAHNANCGAFAVKVSTDNGTTFTELASYTKGSGSSHDAPGDFTPATISLADYAGESIILQFFANATYGNGAIFVDNVEVKAMPTFTKEITGYGTGTGNWYLIASPIGTISNSDLEEKVVNIFSNTYDLYRFDQTKDLEWVNYKKGAFDLEAGKGYLYANSTDIDLVFTGSAYTGTGEFELDYSEGEGLDFPGWNLVGNPFTDVAYIADGRDFYTMQNDGSEILTATSNSIEAMEGVFVIADHAGETITFTTTAPANNGKSVALNVVNGSKVIDRAIVRFGEGRQLPKFQLNKNHTKVYIPQDGNDYAVVRSEEMGEMPISFKAESNGTYTLSFSSENAEFAYLHLIDNMTGNDIDMLQTPSYSFEAKTTDYESRFKLVFATGNAEGETFAFFSNGSFVISNEGNATLQVVDIQGRILKSESINGCANVNVNAAPGVYMLRLVNGDNVKVQKVVVK